MLNSIIINYYLIKKKKQNKIRKFSYYISWISPENLFFVFIIFIKQSILYK